MNHHEPECHTERLVCSKSRSQQGFIWSKYDSFTISSELLILFATKLGLVEHYRKPKCLMKKLNCCAHCLRRIYPGQWEKKTKKFSDQTTLTLLVHSSLRFDYAPATCVIRSPYALLVFTSPPCSKERVPSFGMRPPCVAITALLPREHETLNIARWDREREREREMKWRHENELSRSMFLQVKIQ